MRTVLLIFAAAAIGPATWAQPVRNTWILSHKPPGATEALLRVLPDVHSVEFHSSEAVIRSAGISLAYLGPLEKAPQPKNGVSELVFRLPLQPQAETGVHAHVPSSFVGVFVNGVPVYNQFEANSYRGQNLWHYDLVARSRASLDHPPQDGLIEKLIPTSGRHSPLIGFALDGFPIYGPWGEGAQGLVRHRSSYQLRQISTRESLPDGTLLAPGQSGPPVGVEYPLGSFVEDYEFVAGSGDLDQYNGCLTRTPEYPNGTYAYFLATSPEGKLAFPYLLAHEFYGRYQSSTPLPSDLRRISFRFAAPPHAGQDAVLEFQIFDAKGIPVRHLEHVHERPIHLLIVSADLAEFEHIHPEVNEYGIWQVKHRFAHGGRYRLYADFTPPGEKQRLEPFDVETGGPRRAAMPLSAAPPTLPIALENGKSLRAGQDEELRFSLRLSGHEPYLGAWAHVVIAGENFSSFSHAHPIEEGMTSIRASEEHVHGMETLGPPPTLLRVATSFPKEGRYKLWLQLQLAGQVKTIPFVVDVAPGTSPRQVSPIPSNAIRVKINPNGYEPMRVMIPAGKPVSIAFERSAQSNCGGKVVFPALGLSKEVPLGGSAVFEVPAQPAGEYRFTCGMGMYRSSIVVGRF